jgi:hypothetical protein
MTPANIPWRLIEAAQSRVERGQTEALSNSAADASALWQRSGEAESGIRSPHPIQ